MGEFFVTAVLVWRLAGEDFSLADLLASELVGRSLGDDHTEFEQFERQQVIDNPTESRHSSMNLSVECTTGLAGAYAPGGRGRRLSRRSGGGIRIRAVRLGRDTERAVVRRRCIGRIRMYIPKKPAPPGGRSSCRVTPHKDWVANVRLVQEAS